MRDALADEVGKALVKHQVAVSEVDALVKHGGEVRELLEDYLRTYGRDALKEACTAFSLCLFKDICGRI